MKKEHLLSLLYIPLTLCASVPGKRATEDAALINSNVEAEDPQELLINAQRVFEDAVNQQLNEMDMDMNELWDGASEDIQQIIDNYDISDHLMDEPTLKEDASNNIFGGIFGTFEKGVKDIADIADDLTSGTTGKNTDTKNDKKSVNDTKVNTPVVQSQNKTDTKLAEKVDNLVGDVLGAPEKSKNGTDASKGSSPLSQILGGSLSANGSAGIHIPNLLNNTSAPDFIHGFISSITNATHGLIGDKGMANFGNGTDLENLVGLAGSTVGKFFNGGLFGAGNPAGKLGDFFKGVVGKVSSFFPDPKTYKGFFLVPLIGGILDMLKDAVLGLLKGLGDTAMHALPKMGAHSAKKLPGFLRYQTHEYLVEDLSNLKNIFLGAMRVENPVAADQFHIFFDKFYTVLEHAHSIDPSMAEALTTPTEENIRIAVQSLSKVLSDLQ